MSRFSSLALKVALVVLTTTRASGGDPPLASPRPELNPQEVFQAAYEHLKDLEAKHALLNGVSKVKPHLLLDENNRLKSAGFVFERNAVPPGKNPAKAQDETKPFVYVSVQVWAGHSQQPPVDVQGFEWKGKEHQAWVQVYGSDAALVKAVRKAVAEPIPAPIPKK